ncbi:MAG: PKD domain-containing protein, partial [Flavobacteriales bacterium]|nr:PKD domain-containing protein [Flavobacteriales bacterium]
TTLGFCTDSIAKTINITETPAPAFTHDGPKCEGATVLFTYGGTTDPGWTYAWDFGAGAMPATSTAEDSIEVMYTGTGAKTVTLTVTGVCSESIVNSTLNIMQTPVADFSSTAPSCTGDQVDFMNTGTAGASYSWTFGLGASPATDTVANPVNIIYGSAGIKSVMLITTLGTCTDTSAQTINITQTPAPLFSNNGPKCEGEEMIFIYGGTVGLGWTYAWDFGASATPNTSTVSSGATTMYTGPGNKTVSLTVTNDMCSSTVTNSTASVNENPTASLTSTAPKCTGDSVHFTNTGSTGGSWAYSWSFGSGATPATDTSENPMNIVYSTDGTKMITLIVGNTMCADTVTTPININLRPTATFASTAPECAEINIDFGNTGSTGANWNYLWDFGGNANPSTSNAENPTDINFETGGLQTISFTISDQFCSETFTNTITVYSLPTANAGADTVICNNASVSIGTTSTPGYAYSWTQSSTLSSGSSSNPTASPTAPVTTYIVSVTDGNGCMSEDSVIITMLQSAMVNAGPDGEICLGDTVQIGVGLLLGQTYQWAPQTGLDNPAISSPMAAPTSSTTYTVTVQFENCPPITDDVWVEVHPLPDAKATDYLLQDTSFITLGNSILLIATGGLQFSWLPEVGLSNPGLYNPVATPDSTTNYVVQVVDIYGCINWDTVRVDVDSVNFWIPTAFTPDGNGFNDAFMIRIEDMETFELIVWDRWGEQVFISRDAELGWEGLNQTSGDKMPQGAYIYSFKGVDKDGEAITQSGLINLIR